MKGWEACSNKLAFDDITVQVFYSFRGVLVIATVKTPPSCRNLFPALSVLFDAMRVLQLYHSSSMCNRVNFSC